MFLESDELIGSDSIGIELDLDFHIPCGRTKGTGDLAGKPGVGILGSIEKIVAAISLAGERFENLIVESLGTNSSGIEGDSRVPECLDLGGETGRFRVAQVGGSIGEEDDAVLGVRDLLLLRFLEGEIERRLKVGSALAGKVDDPVEKGFGIRSLGAIGEETRLTSEADEGDFVGLLQLSEEEAQGSLYRLAAVGALHRSRVVEKEGQAKRHGGLATSRSRRE